MRTYAALTAFFAFTTLAAACILPTPESIEDAPGVEPAAPGPTCGAGPADACYSGHRPAECIHGSCAFECASIVECDALCAGKPSGAACMRCDLAGSCKDGKCESDDPAPPHCGAVAKTLVQRPNPGLLQPTPCAHPCKTGQSCDPFTGQCSCPAACDDDDPCTIDGCDSLGCTHTPVECPSATMCDQSSGACLPFIAPRCMDSAQCNSNDQCLADVCLPSGICAQYPKGNTATCDAGGAMIGHCNPSSHSCCGAYLVDYCNGIDDPAACSAACSNDPSVCVLECVQFCPPCTIAVPDQGICFPTC